MIQDKDKDVQFIAQKVDSQYGKHWSILDIDNIIINTYHFDTQIFS
jgi:ribosomal silencing factor RsfS